jgi:ankyrin repeat protein
MGHEEVAHLLLERGVDVNAQDNRGRTPLHNATVRGRVGIVSLLLESGADMFSNWQDNDGWSPLHVAAFEGHVELACFLLNLGIDATAQTSDGMTPLEMALQREHEQIVLLLLKYMDMAAQDDQG